MIHHISSYSIHFFWGTIYGTPHQWLNHAQAAGRMEVRWPDFRDFFAQLELGTLGTGQQEWHRRYPAWFIGPVGYIQPYITNITDIAMIYLFMAGYNLYHLYHLKFTHM